MEETYGADHYYEYQSEIQELQKKLEVLKRKKKMTKLKEQLTKLNFIHAEAKENIATLHNNIAQFNGDVHSLSQVLSRTEKLNMKENSAQDIKSVLNGLSAASFNTEKTNNKGNNLNEINEDMLNNVSKRLDGYQSNYNCIALLLENVLKVSGIKNYEIHDTPKVVDNCNHKPNSVVNDISHSSSVLTFSETNLFASSPF